MPRISEAVLNSIFYLYPSASAAERGEPYGGTGFLVAYVPAYSFNRNPPVYAVTNWHVMKDSPVVRLILPDGHPKIFDFDPSDWHWIADGDDMAAILVPSGPHLDDFVREQPIACSMFATHDVVRHMQIGVGDDVFMVGRFVDHDAAGCQGAGH